MPRKSQPNPYSRCPIDVTTHILFHKWTLPIVRELFISARRPSQLQKSLKGISSKVLTQRLKQLEEWGIVEKTTHEGTRRHTTFALTELGNALYHLVVELKRFGEQWERKMNVPLYEEASTSCAVCPYGGDQYNCPAIPDLVESKSSVSSSQGT